MTKNELRKAFAAAGHSVVENRLSSEELEEIERELDETVGIDDARFKVLVERAKKAAELGMPYQAVARKVLQAAFS